MKHIELHCHYLRQLVQEKIFTLVYYRIDDQLVDFFMKPISKPKFVKFRALLGLQEASFIGGCTNVISPLESLEYCVDGGGGCWNHKLCCFIMSLDLLETIS